MPDEETKTLTLHLQGRYADGSEISLANLDPSLLETQVRCWRQLIGDEENARLSIETGSVKAIFLLPVTAYISLVSDIQNYQGGKWSSISSPSRANALQMLDRKARAEQLSLSIATEEREIYNSATSINVPGEKLEIDAEMDVEGIVMDAGGRSKRPNIHLIDKNGVKYKIEATRDELARIKTNILYKHICIHVAYKYDILLKTGRSYQYRYIVENSDISKDDLDNLVAGESPKWSDISDVPLWLLQHRGEGEA